MGPSHPWCNSRSSPTYHLHSRGNTRVPPTSRGAPFPHPSSRGGILSLRVGKDFPAFPSHLKRRRSPQERREEFQGRATFPESARKFLVGNFIGLPRKPSYSAFFYSCIILASFFRYVLKFNMLLFCHISISVNPFQFIFHQKHGSFAI